MDRRFFRQPPARIGRYWLLDMLGAGGMGQIYAAAYEAAPDVFALCALKTIRPDLGRDSRFVRRFAQEARLALLLEHPNVVKVFEIGRASAGQLFLAMELVEGHNLGRVIRRARRHNELPSVSAALYIACQLLDALSYCHGLRGDDGRPLAMVHRDISPCNVLVGYDGRVKLADFGLAVSADRGVITDPSTVFGKVGYAAPEQLKRQPTDHRADIYAVGALLFEMLTGEPLVRTRDLTVVISEQRRRARIAPSSLRPGIPPVIDAAVRCALAPTPRDRFDTAADFARVLCAGLPGGARLGSGDTHTARWMRGLFDRRRLRAKLDARFRQLLQGTTAARPVDRSIEGSLPPSGLCSTSSVRFTTTSRSISL